MSIAKALTDELADPENRDTDSELPAREAEGQLIHSLRKGEDSGFDTLVRSYGSQVLAIARRYLQSEADAADCFQDTFVAIFQSIDSFQQRSSFRHWVRSVTVNQCLMKRRKRQRRREDSIEHMLPDFDDRGHRVDVTGPRENSGIAESLDAEQMRRILREKIDNLPEDHRLVLLLRDIDGYSTAETASILGIKVNAVKTRLHRARSALKFMLEPVLEQVDGIIDL